MRTKEIKLTQGKFAIVDDEDYERINQHKWHAYFNGYTWYARRSSPMMHGKRVKIHMHREIMNAPEDTEGDHRNRNGLDNRKENLRTVTHNQNQFNKNYYRNNKLKIKGVHWNRKLKKFQASIQVNGKRIHLGCFNVLGDADSAYRIAEEKYYGEFARAV